MSKVDSFKAARELEVSGKRYRIFDISKLDAKTLPYSLKILLENLLRTEDGANVTSSHINSVIEWNPKAEPDTEIQHWNSPPGKH